MSEEEFKAKYEELKSNPMYQQYCEMIDTKNKIIDKIQQENKILKTLLMQDHHKIHELVDVINEIREYIEKTPIGSILEVHCGEEEEYTKPLLQILDKVEK